MIAQMLGRTLEELRQTLTYDELQGWIAYLSHKQK